jgi:tetratricopeptide (TPR) repeat protein
MQGAATQNAVDAEHAPPAAREAFKAGMLSRSANSSIYMEASPEAIECFNKAIKLAPNFVAAYIARGHAKASREDFKSAIEDYNIAIKLKPDNIRLRTAYAFRAFSESALMQNEKALEDITRAQELGYESDGATRLKLETLKKLGRTDKEIEELNKILAKAPDAYGLRLRRAELYLEEKHYDIGIKEFTYILSHNKYADIDELYYFRACCYFGQHKYADALKDISDAIKHEDSVDRYYAFRAKCYKALGNEKAAMADEATASRVKSKSPYD